MVRNHLKQRRNLRKLSNKKKKKILKTIKRKKLRKLQIPKRSGKDRKPGRKIKRSSSEKTSFLSHR